MLQTNLARLQDHVLKIETTKTGVQYFPSSIAILKM